MPLFGHSKPGHLGSRTPRRKPGSTGLRSTSPTPTPEGVASVTLVAVGTQVKAALVKRAADNWEVVAEPDGPTTGLTGADAVRAFRRVLDA